MTLLDHDDAFVAELRALADTEQPRLDLDPETVTHAGRARRRRRAVRVGAALGIVALGVMVGVGQWARPFDPPEPMPAVPVQEPRPLGDGQTVELAPGVVAANRPVAVTVDSFAPRDTRVQDLGFATRLTERIGGKTTVPGQALLRPLDDVTMMEDGKDGSGEGLAIYSVHDGEAWVSTSLTWPLDPEPDEFTGEVRIPLAHLRTPGSDAKEVVVGTVPEGVVAPRVELFSEQGFTLADGTVQHTLEVPTFRSLLTDGPLVFAVSVTPEDPGGDESGDEADVEMVVDLVLVRDADGGVHVGDQCSGSGMAGCIEQYGATLLGVGVLAGAGDVDALGYGAVIGANLDSLAAAPEVAWTLDGGRWTAPAVIGDVVVLNHAQAPPGTPGDGPELWDWSDVGVDLTTGEELWRWPVGTGESPTCLPASPSSGYGPEVMECWTDSPDMTSTASYHDARDGSALPERSRSRGESEEPSHGGYDTRVVTAGRIISPAVASGRQEEDAQIVALDPVSGDELWRARGGWLVGSDGDRVLTARTGDDELVLEALDVATGAVQWTFQLDDGLRVQAIHGKVFVTRGVSHDDFPLAESLLAFP